MPEALGCGPPAEDTDLGPCMPVHDDKRLATSKKPLRDGTKRCVTLFMWFLLYLLVVVVQDALTSPCVAACRSYLCLSSLLSAGVMG